MPAVGDQSVKPLVFLLNRIPHPLVHRNDQPLPRLRGERRGIVEEGLHLPFPIHGHSQLGTFAIKRERHPIRHPVLRIHETPRHFPLAGDRNLLDHQTAVRHTPPFSPRPFVGHRQRTRPAVDRYGQTGVADGDRFARASRAELPAALATDRVLPDIDIRDPISNQAGLDARDTIRNQKPAAHRLTRPAGNGGVRPLMNIPLRVPRDDRDLSVRLPLPAMPPHFTPQFKRITGLDRQLSETVQRPIAGWRGVPDPISVPLRHPRRRALLPAPDARILQRPSLFRETPNPDQANRDSQQPFPFHFPFPPKRTGRI